MRAFWPELQRLVQRMQEIHSIRPLNWHGAIQTQLQDGSSCDISFIDARKMPILRIKWQDGVHHMQLTYHARSDEDYTMLQLSSPTAKGLMQVHRSDEFCRVVAGPGAASLQKRLQDSPDLAQTIADKVQSFLMQAPELEQQVKAIWFADLARQHGHELENKDQPSQLDLGL